MTQSCYRKSWNGIDDQIYTIDSSHTDVPCGNYESDDGNYACCKKGHQCLDDLLCYAPCSEDGASGFYTAACTDQTYGSTACNQHCGTLTFKLKFRIQTRAVQQIKPSGSCSGKLTIGYECHDLLHCLSNPLRSRYSVEDCDGNTDYTRSSEYVESCDRIGRDEPYKPGSEYWIKSGDRVVRWCRGHRTPSGLGLGVQKTQMFGYDQGVMSRLLSGDAFTARFPEIDTTNKAHGSSPLQGTVVAIYEIGCFLGAIMSLLVGEKLGRRNCILAGCVVLSIGAALQCSAYGIPQLIVGRIVAGVDNGINTSTIPVWYSELSKAASCGKGLAIELGINIFGMIISYWIDYGFYYVESEAQFRFPIALQILFAVFTFFGILCLPEPPRWAIREETEASAEGSFKLIFQNGDQKFLYRTLLVKQYATEIFEDSVGMSHNTALHLSGFNGIAYFLSALIPIWVIDRPGRRKLMMFAVVGQGCCMAVLAGTVWNGGHAAGLVATVMLFLFNFFFGVGLLAIPWLLPAEYSPLAIRKQSAALATGIEGSKPLSYVI
ncbi:hypothetical protein N7488_004736 [Penicillium malachiteum]|nr:hypothetical protein N7488_004736 [Penicillium malachiteum]